MKSCKAANRATALPSWGAIHTDSAVSPHPHVPSWNLRKAELSWWFQESENEVTKR